MRILAIFTAITCLQMAARAIDTAAWRNEQSVVIETPGLVRLDVPPETMNASLPQLADLRLVSPSGSETPYVIEWPVFGASAEFRPRAFKASLIDQSTVLELETGTTNAIEAVTFESPAASFIKAARIEGSNDGARWQELAANEILFRQSGGIGRLRIPIASGSWKSLRITVDDTRNHPVPFTAARLTLTRTMPAAVAHFVAIETREETPRQTRLTIRLGAANVPLALLRIAADDAVFSRRVTLSYVRDNNGQTVESMIGSADIYRATEDGLSTASLEIPIHHVVPMDRIIATIQNGDSPPLKITGLDAERHPVSLVFFASETGAWKLLSGNTSATAPNYDLAALKQGLSKERGIPLKPGTLATNAAFEEPPALPGVNSEGASIDLARWHYRKPVVMEQSGVLRLELDAETLAHSQSSLGDMRLIQNGKQIPFLVDHTNASRALRPEVMKSNDPKRPAVSLWKLSLPVDGLPATRLTLNSPAPLFERTLEVWAKTKDYLGNEYRTHLGSARWTRQTGGAKNELAVSLTPARVPSVFFIETHNGDNPSIEIENVQVHHAVSVIVAKITDRAPIYLYYGNDAASPPRYDLQLVRAELLNTQKQNTATGKEEVLRVMEKALGDPAVGSPWLWAALAVVIVVLLWVVARMLPAAAKSA